MPIAIGFALTAIGATAAAAFVTSAVGSAIINIGLSIGLSLVGNVLMRGKSTTPKPSDGQQSIKQPVAARSRSYGRVRVSGVIWWMDATAATPSTLYIGVALNQGKISSFVSLHIDETAVNIDGSGNVLTGPYNAFTTQLITRLGAAPETKYTQLNTVFGQDNVRGDGVASILGIFANPSNVSDYTKTYPNGRPLIRATIEATLVWDPRASSQTFADPTTWKWSDNAALCILHYLLAGDGYGVPYARVANNLAEWIAAANICDEPVPLFGGGSSARYRLAGSHLLTDDPTAVMANMLSACDGRVWQRRDGQIGISVGRYIPATVVFGPDQIVAYAGLQYGQDPVAEIDGIRANFMSPDHDYREHEAEPWPNAGTVQALSTQRVAALDLTWVPAEPQARRLMKRAYIRAQATWRGTIRTNLAGLQAIDERFVRFTIPELGINQDFEIDRFQYDRQQMFCEFTVRSIDTSIDAWTTSEEGTQEGGSFAFISGFSKQGTTLDVLGEVGALIGQTVLVFASNPTSIPATPGGWTLVTSAGPASGICGAVYVRVLDGTETAVTFNGANGAIQAAVYSGILQVKTAQVQSQILSGGAQNADQTTSPTPYGTIAFVAATGNNDPTNYISAYPYPSKTLLTPDQYYKEQGAAVSSAMALFTYSADAVPPTDLVWQAPDVSTGVQFFASLQISAAS